MNLNQLLDSFHSNVVTGSGEDTLVADLSGVELGQSNWDETGGDGVGRECLQQWKEAECGAQEQVQSARAMGKTVW